MWVTRRAKRILLQHNIRRSYFPNINKEFAEDIGVLPIRIRGRLDTAVCIIAKDEDVSKSSMVRFTDRSDRF